MVEPAGWWCKVHGHSTIICDERLSPYDRTSCDNEPTFTRTDIRKAWEEFAKWHVNKARDCTGHICTQKHAGDAYDDIAKEARRRAKEW